MIAAILCAAGKGVRAGFSENKVLRDLNGLPVLCHCLCAFAPYTDEILIACAPEDEPRIRALLAPYPTARTVLGGTTRGESVYNALRAAKSEIVLVHDAARPFVTEKIIRDCIESVKTYGSGVCALPLSDTVAEVLDGNILNVPPREGFAAVQTPQGFYRNKLLGAYERARADGRIFTDESGVYAAYAESPRLFLGDRANKKLTYPEDFAPAERVGFGVDTHAFGEGDHVVLCGVKVPSARGLVAHSDGDAAVHALMDAMLSAAGMRDIGYYFPDTDDRFAGADSMKLLQEVVGMLREKDLRVKNASISIVAERPRLAPYVEEMKSTLADALGTDVSCVGVAAGTNEKLGYVGEGKGITCFATVLLTGIAR